MLQCLHFNLKPICPISFTFLLNGMFILKIPGAFKSDNTKQIYPQNDFLTLNIIRIGEECPYKYAKYIYIAPRKTALPKERMLSSIV